MESKLVIPIENIFAVANRRDSGVIELYFCYSITDASGNAVYVRISVPDEVSVYAPRIGKINTSFDGGLSYVLGLHDEYTVKYRDTTIVISPKTIMDITVNNIPMGHL